MTDQQSESNSSTPDSSQPEIGPQRDMGLMLQRRALLQMERANEKPPRSPKRIALVSIMVIATMALFLLLIDKGIKVTHRIVDIWAPVIFDAQNAKPKPQESASSSQGSASSSSEAAYMIRVEPTSPANNSQSTSQNTK